MRGLGNATTIAAFLATSIATTLATSHAEASPEDVFGFGPRASAMGATGAASALGFEAVYANPALLSDEPERRLALGFVGAHFDLHAGDKRVPYDALHASLIGATLPIPFGGALHNRVVVGLGFFTPFDLVVRGRILFPEKPQFQVADRTQSVAVQAGIGVDVGYGVRVGAGFAALAALSGNVLVATDASGRIGTVVEDTLVASYGPILGATYERFGYRLGLTYRGTLQGRFNVVINVKDLGDLTVPPLNISGVAQYDPWQLAMEVARVRGPWRVAVGATFKHWSSYPGPADATVRCPDVDPITGKPFTDSCTAPTPPPPDYHDTLAVHVGAERTLLPADNIAMKLRAGALFEPSPAPEQTTLANHFDNTRLGLSLGYGLSLASPLPPIDLDLFAQSQLLLPRTHHKDASIAASNPGAPSIDTSGVIVAGGATAGVRF
jgi:long-chain fatty acid transport protein